MRLELERLETVEDCEGDKMEVVGGVTIERRRLFGTGVLERGLGEEPLFLDVLDKVATKFDLSDRATEDSVARKRRVRLAGRDVVVTPLEDVERSALRCSIVVVGCL
jgi:hypothetical protein